MKSDNNNVQFESFEEIRKRNEEKRKHIAAWNKGFYGEPYQSTLKEEMKLSYGNQGAYIGKGPLY